MRNVPVLVLVISVLALMFSVSAASAKEFDQQLLLDARLESPVGEDRTTIVAVARTMVVPGNHGISRYEYHLGPGIEMTDRWYSSPRFGVVMGVPEPERGAPVFLWENVFGSPEGRLSLAFETAIFPGERIRYYGFYCADYAAGEFVETGVHIEQEHDMVAAGPHVALELTHGLGANIGYYGNFVADHALRIGVGITF